MKKIFISYTLRDDNIDKKFLCILRDWIVNQKYECYIDLLDNNYNEKGFQDRLIEILKTCDIFIRIDSIEYMNSKWTRMEIEEAKINGLKIVKISSEQLKKMVIENENLGEYLQ